MSNHTIGTSNPNLLAFALRSAHAMTPDQEARAFRRGIRHVVEGGVVSLSPLVGRAQEAFLGLRPLLHAHRQPRDRRGRFVSRTRAGAAIVNAVAHGHDMFLAA